MSLLITINIKTTVRFVPNHIITFEYQYQGHRVFTAEISTAQIAYKFKDPHKKQAHVVKCPIKRDEI